MEKAGGGSTSSDMLPEDLDGVMAFLGREDVEIAQKLLVEKYGESLYRELGFTKQSETINGRLAMVGFLAGFGALFTGSWRSTGSPCTGSSGSPSSPRPSTEGSRWSASSPDSAPSSPVTS